MCVSGRRGGRKSESYILSTEFSVLMMSPYRLADMVRGEMETLYLDGVAAVCDSSGGRVVPILGCLCMGHRRREEGASTPNKESAAASVRRDGFRGC